MKFGELVKILNKKNVLFFDADLRIAHEKINKIFYSNFVGGSMYSNLAKLNQANNNTKIKKFLKKLNDNKINIFINALITDNNERVNYMLRTC